MYQHFRLVDVTMTVDTAAYANGDLVANVQEIANFFQDNAKPARLQSVTIIDPDDQKAPVSLVFSQVSTSFGSENSAPNIADADALNMLGQVTFVAGDYVDMGGVAIGTKTGLNLILAPASGKSLYMGIMITTGTPTFAGGSLKVRLGVEYD